jgi:2-polyprenyl-3-methyl-5-hydroxy-6-metoxy-1,4-benzoquinol methylase
MARIGYFVRSLAAQFSSARFTCPNCNADGAAVVDRKYRVTQLRRCRSCSLLFRTPTDRPAANAAFYEHGYRQGFTTTMPDDATLAALKRANFTGSEKDYGYYIAVLKNLGVPTGARVFDYGCSWGYGSYQLGQAGFDVVAYDVAATRRHYAADKLAVRTVANMDDVTRTEAGAFDCFFSAHVIEHLPRPARAFDDAMRLLKPGGLFVSFTPNGSAPHRAASVDWSKLWGEVHPNFIDVEFFDRSFSAAPRAAGSSPVAAPVVPQVAHAALPEALVLHRFNDLTGGELFFVARKVGSAWR